MSQNRDVRGKHTEPMIRVLIMLSALVVAVLISYYFTGSPFPKDEKHALIFQNTLLLVVLGSTILEHYFTKPADSMINSLMAGITMIGVYHVSDIVAWSIVFAYCAFVFIISTICVAASGGRIGDDVTADINNRLYRPAVALGKARLIFSIVFLFGIYSFYSIQSPQSVVLIIYWGVFMAIWPLKLPQLISDIIFSPHQKKIPIGKLLRIDNPSIMRIGITQCVDWTNRQSFIYQRVDKSQLWILPLYSHLNDERRIGTAIILGEVDEPIMGLNDGHIYTANENLTEEKVMNLLGENNDSRMVGFVVEDSSIGRILFEVNSNSECFDGMLVWCTVNGKKVFYQVTGGTTREESLDDDKHGFQTAFASQLGELDAKGFHKFDWLPSMNTPLFTHVNGAVSLEESLIDDNVFKFGNLPNSKISVVGDFVDNFNFHTAILGVTGSGKTEFAFDLIKHAADKGLKIICIDLTSQYLGRLAQNNPIDLSISEENATALSGSLFDVETGKYGAGEEKKALKILSDNLRADIRSRLEEFINSDEEKLGIIQLRDISNSQASIFITEIYMSCLLSIAKDNFENDSQKILIVVEEAHTVMPELTTMGVSDFASKSLVAKISQIALQGRKYDVGLLILAQRTANVSKTVLTQCNSIISFACYDETSIGFLRNVFGSSCANMVPDLKNLQAVVFGKIVQSDRPIVVEIPFKKELS